MTLELNDPRWNDLEGSYGGVADVLIWLNKAYEQGGLTDELLGNLINEVQHQGDSSSAMYAVAPHLIELSINAEPRLKIALLTHAGVIFAEGEKDGRADCPDFIEDDFLACAPHGAGLLAPILAETEDFQEFQWAVAALAGFLGHDLFARLLGNLELYEGEFHYALINDTLPVDS